MAPVRRRAATVRGLAAATLSALLASAPVAAQQLQPVRTTPVPGLAAPVDNAGALFLASALVPGSAQLLSGDQRWVAYISAEAWGWVSYINQRRTGRSLENRYRDLAWQVARRASEGVRRDTVFEYYEAMAYYGSSGVLDMDPGLPGIQPERQTGTFNGDLWTLAREIHGGATVAGTPEYERALTYYLSRAIPPAYAWAWGASHLEQQVFADLITESDAAFRSASRYVGLILANHLTSAVDALITARLRQITGDQLRFESGPAKGTDGMRWEYGVRVRF